MLSSSRALSKLIQPGQLALASRFSSSDVPSASPISRRQEPSDYYPWHYPEIGNRDVVGFGRNGMPQYYDDPMHPYPSIRFRENNDALAKLIKKEEGDWNELTMDEKKTLYRASFSQTFAEMRAPTGHWKISLTWVLVNLSITAFIYYMLKQHVYTKFPGSFSEEIMDANTWKQVMLKHGHIDGVSSKFDYEKMRWKE